MRAFLRWAGCPVLVAVLVAVLVGLSARSGGNSPAGGPTSGLHNSTPSTVLPSISQHPDAVPAAPNKHRPTVPRPDHVVVVMFENENHSSVLGNKRAIVALSGPGPASERRPLVTPCSARNSLCQRTLTA